MKTLSLVIFLLITAKAAPDFFASSLKSKEADKPVNWLKSSPEELSNKYTNLKENVWKVDEPNGILFYRQFEAKGELVFVEWAKQGNLDPTFLWGRLDELAYGGTWVELEKQIPSDLKIFLDSQASQHWVLFGNQKWIHLAEYRFDKSKNRSYLRVIPLNLNIPTNSSPLSFTALQFPQTDFIGNSFAECISAKSPCQLVHRVIPQLSVSTNQGGGVLKFEYLGDSEKAYDFPSECRELTENQRLAYAEDLRLWVDYELERSFMLFADSFLDFWTWSAWDWRANKLKYSIKRQELEVYAKNCQLPANLKLWSIATPSGEIAIINDLKGRAILELK